MPLPCRSLLFSFILIHFSLFLVLFLSNRLRLGKKRIFPLHNPSGTLWSLGFWIFFSSFFGFVLLQCDWGDPVASPVLARDPGQVQKNRIRFLDSIFSYFAKIDRFSLCSFLLYVYYCWGCNILFGFLREKKKGWERNGMKYRILDFTRCLGVEETVTCALFFSETTLWLSGRVFILPP